MNIDNIRGDFPILQRKVKGKPLVYLDNAATSQKPQQVIDAMSDYYCRYNANVNRGVHTLSEEATEAYENAHKTVGRFINAEWGELIFTKNTTESMNLVMHSLSSRLRKGDEIVVSRMEHHSNLVPWQQLCRQTGAVLKFLEMTESGELAADFSVIGPKTKIVAVTHVSNMLGTVNDVKKIARVAHENNALAVIDAAQSVPHMPVDVKKLEADFIAFSGHKMLGPTGIGGLYGRKELLETMPPFLYGGDMIREVSYETASWNELPWKFEAGTPPIAEGIGLAAALDYLKKVGMENIRSHEQRLTRAAMDALSALDYVAIYGPAAEKRGGVVSFNVNGIHAHDVSSLLDDEGIAVRGGHHCAMPLMKKLSISGSVRASFYLYNTEEEVEKLATALQKVQVVFR